MHAPSDTLVRMANDISNFFRAQGEEKAVAGIANHIKMFWEPRMKQQIFAHVDAGGAGLNPVALKAIEKLKAEMHGMPTMAEAKAVAESLAHASPQPKAQANGNRDGKHAKR